MGDVKEFKARVEARKVDSTKVFECDHCHSQLFILICDGHVMCYDCEALAANLKVIMPEGLG